MQRHSNAWTELRAVPMGKMTTLIPIYHPARDWVETVCDVWETDDQRDLRRAKARGALPEAKEQW